MGSMSCPKCGQVTIRVRVNLFLDIPFMFYGNLSKQNLRSKDTKVGGADWPQSRLYCDSCGWLQAVDQKEQGDTHE